MYNILWPLKRLKNILDAKRIVTHEDKAKSRTCKKLLLYF